MYSLEAQIKELAKDWCKMMIAIKKNELVTSGKLEPAAYLIFSEPVNAQADIVCAHLIPGVEMYFYTDNKIKDLPAYLKRTCKEYIAQSINDKQKLRGIFLLMDCRYDITPEAANDRDRAIYGVLDFFDNKMYFQYNYEMDGNKISFGKELINNIDTIDLGFPCDLFLSPQEIIDTETHKRKVQYN
jgi:hypothetical protein